LGGPALGQPGGGRRTGRPPIERENPPPASWWRAPAPRRAKTTQPPPPLAALTPIAAPVFRHHSAHPSMPQECPIDPPPRTLALRFGERGVEFALLLARQPPRLAGPGAISRGRFFPSAFFIRPAPQKPRPRAPAVFSMPRIGNGKASPSPWPMNAQARPGPHRNFSSHGPYKGRAEPGPRLSAGPMFGRLWPPCVFSGRLGGFRSSNSG